MEISRYGSEISCFCGGGGGRVTIVLLSSIGGMCQLIKANVCPMYDRESFSVRVEIYFQEKDRAEYNEIGEKITTSRVIVSIRFGFEVSFVSMLF